ncbi:MAG: dihydrofolate reductase family protein [Gaiellaceae bacterium]
MMGKVFLDISMSLDGFVAGPDPSLEEPLGRNGERLHDWVVGLRGWRESHGLEGGEENESSALVVEGLASSGAVVMGRRMFSGGAGSWDDDPKAYGWWGDDPPFRKPVFVVTHHEREPLVLGETTFAFVGGVEAAIEQATAAAGAKDVLVAGGASVAQQAVRAGLLDEMQLNLVPLLLGGGTRLLDNLASDVELERMFVLDSPSVTHIRYRVARHGR